MRLAPLRGQRRPEVQMSPLIDVIFLLLIFYAVTTQFVSDERLKLKLPEAETAESVGINREEKPPEVKVAVDGSSRESDSSWSGPRTTASFSRVTREPTTGS
jgi:biopolymer transport protein ExbD